jgi:hypothetical protein
MVSRMPPISPARMRLQKRLSNTLGCFARESLKVLPPSTSAFTWRRMPAKKGLSFCEERISRHCTRGRPASIIVANWRVKMTRSLVETLPPPKPKDRPFFFTVTGVSCCARSLTPTAASSSASITPVRTSPPRVFAS